MNDRRTFLGGMAGLSVAAAAPAVAATSSVPARFAPVVEAIRAYAALHRRHYGLPALSMGLALPGGEQTTLLLGEARPGVPLTAPTRVHIGSITKCMTALLVHQAAAGGRLDLDADIRRLMPEMPWPDGRPITPQQLLDHVSGLSSSAPAYPATGKLWRGFEPGAHWSYCNAGYEHIGRLLERIEGKPLPRLYEERIFAPLGMTASTGQIQSRDRLLHAQGYEPVNRQRVHIVRGPLVPAPWVDTTNGAGCVASTPGDMVAFMRALARLRAGAGGIGLSPAQGRAYIEHTVTMDGAPMRYGNGLMHQTDGGRVLLHHTGGMPSFSSSMHIDPDGVAAYASAAIGYPADYRPRLLTLFAVKAIRLAAAGETLPAPPPLVAPVENAADYAGRYSGPRGTGEVRGGAQLSVLTGGRTVPLQGVDTDVFQPADAGWADFPFRFERRDGKVVAIGWGSDWLVREGSGFTPPPSDPRLARLAGRYINDDPWQGVAVLVERGGALWGGGFVPIVRLSDDLYRVGTEDFAPERLRFSDMVKGVPQTAWFSERPFERRDG